MAPLTSSRRLVEMSLVLLAMAVGLALGASDDDYAAITYSETDAPQWTITNALQLNLSLAPKEWLPQQYTVVPLTESLGLNESEVVHVDGTLKKADDTNYNEITSSGDVAYLSCDEPEHDTNIDPNKMLNDLMEARPKAIVLYSITKNWCALEYDDALGYTNILSMVDSGEAAAVLGYLNGTDSGKVVRVSITGNTTDLDPNSEKHNRGGSTVAMSVLYSITGLICMLFLVIIATGAIRAHRYPERYGPRRAFGGRPRQSRAKGLARAVLETLPIVKFGDEQPAKPDPELEMDAATTDGQDIATQRTVSALSQEQHRDGAAVAGEGSKAAALPPTPDSSAINVADRLTDEHLGCSICTEDFEVGEDVRVLPCSHQFHPNCIDPWLVNVSGTCPLCRLDLHPPKGNTNGESASNHRDSLPPPLALEGDEATTTTHRNRLSRIFDINRLRQATAEEQIEALRQMRAQGSEAEAEPVEADREARHQGARFADKLKEKFRIRTRAQPPERRDC